MKDEKGLVSHAEAEMALQHLDEFSRMGCGVDAFGPRGVLERYIRQQQATEEVRANSGDSRKTVVSISRGAADLMIRALAEQDGSGAVQMLERYQKCGLPYVEQAAKILLDYYQGFEPDCHQETEEVPRLPRNAEQVRAMIGGNYISTEYGRDDEIPSDNDKYLLSAHDLLSAFSEWHGEEADSIHERADKYEKIICYTYQIAAACGVPANILDILCDPERATDEQIEAMLPYSHDGMMEEQRVAKELLDDRARLNFIAEHGSGIRSNGDKRVVIASWRKEDAVNGLRRAIDKLRAMP